MRLSRIIPAYAGSTVAGQGHGVTGADHPRIRGEHVWILTTDGLPPGSSPHTRGARRRVRRLGAGRGIIPAYAGSTTSTPPACAKSPDHPRIRGEHAGQDRVEAGE